MWGQTDGKYIKFKLNMYYSNFKFCWQPVWLVGGFGGSPWLLKQLREGLKDIGVEVSCHDTNLWVYMLSLFMLWTLLATVSFSSKAVANGGGNPRDFIAKMKEGVSLRLIPSRACIAPLLMSWWTWLMRLCFSLFRRSAWSSSMVLRPVPLRSMRFV